MNNWILALIIAGMLLIAGCAMWINAVGKNTDEIIDFAERVLCYDSGFQDARNGLTERPPAAVPRACDELYADGYADGLSGTYDPPEGE